MADGTKEYCARLVVRSIPMSLLRRKSCSALASTILESPLHRTKATCTIFFCAICQAALPGRPFDTRILYGKKAIIPLWRRGNMSLSRAAAGGESCQQPFFIYFYLSFFIFIYFPENAAWVSYGQRIIRYIFCDNASGADNGAIPYCYAREDNDTAS